MMSPFALGLAQLGFSEIWDVTGRPSIALLVREKKLKSRTGIYLLRFSDDAYYIGRAVDIVRRFSQHRRIHGARIVGFAFQKCAKKTLEARERDCIHLGERLGIPLSQTLDKTTVYGQADLDEIISPAEAAQWLNDPSPPADDVERAVFNYDMGRRARDARMLTNLSSRKDYLQLVRLLKLYVNSAIPAPRLTEHDFWNVSCLPSTNKPTWQRLFCVSAHVMELFVVGYHRNDEYRLSGFVNLAESIVVAKYPSADDLIDHFGEIDLRQGRHYLSAGYDQLQIVFSDVETAEALLRDSTIRKACAQLNYNVMRKGVNTYAKFHCSALADVILQQELSEGSPIDMEADHNSHERTEARTKSVRLTATT